MLDIEESETNAKSSALSSAVVQNGRSVLFCFVAAYLVCRRGFSFIVYSFACNIMSATTGTWDQSQQWRKLRWCFTILSFSDPRLTGQMFSSIACWRCLNSCIFHPSFLRDIYPDQWWTDFCYSDHWQAKGQSWSSHGRLRWGGGAFKTTPLHPGLEI